MYECQINPPYTGSKFVPSSPQNFEGTRASRGFSILSRVPINSLLLLYRTLLRLTIIYQDTIMLLQVFVNYKRNLNLRRIQSFTTFDLPVNYIYIYSQFRKTHEDYGSSYSYATTATRQKLISDYWECPSTQSAVSRFKSILYSLSPPFYFANSIQLDIIQFLTDTEGIRVKLKLFLARVIKRLWPYGYCIAFRSQYSRSL